MTRRLALALSVALAATATLLPSAAADEILDADDIESEGYPAASLVVTLPSGVDPDDLADDAFRVIENGEPVPASATALASEQLDVVLAILTANRRSSITWSRLPSET